MDPAVAAKFAARAAGTVSVQTTPATPAVSPERSRIDQKLAAHARAKAAPAPAAADVEPEEKPEPQPAKREHHSRNR
jgi:hypothetical protein